MKEKADSLFEHIESVSRLRQRDAIERALRDTHNQAIEAAAQFAFGYAREKIEGLKR